MDNPVMQTGWKFIGDAWYYLNESGAMLSKGWHWIDGRLLYGCIRKNDDLIRGLALVM